jgi:hypothetical protein
LTENIGAIVMGRPITKFPMALTMAPTLWFPFTLRIPSLICIMTFKEVRSNFNSNPLSHLNNEVLASSENVPQKSF